MHARLYKPDDHAMLTQWWVGHGGAAVPERLLPELGIITNDGKDDLAAAFCYFDDSKPIVFAAWFVTKPGITFKRVERALKHLLGALETVARSRHNNAMLIPMVEKPSLLKWLKTQGYVLGCEGAAILVKPN